MIDDFVPATYTCLYAGVTVAQEGRYLKSALERAREDEVYRLVFYPEGWKNYTQNVTAYISDDIGEVYHQCTTMGWEWYDWGVEYFKSFKSNETQGWPISALQTLLENIITITQINQALVQTVDSKDFINFSFLMGRLIRVVMIVKPMPVDTFENQFLADIYIHT